MAARAEGVRSWRERVDPPATALEWKCYLLVKKSFSSDDRLRVWAGQNETKSDSSALGSAQAIHADWGSFSRSLKLALIAIDIRETEQSLLASCRKRPAHE